MLGLAYPKMTHPFDCGAARSAELYQGGEAKMPTRWRQPKSLCPLERARVVLICEGETDWLAVHRVVRGARKAGRADTAVLGMVSMSRGWPSEWGRLVAHAERIVVLVDKGQPKRSDPRSTAERTAAQIADSLAEQLGGKASDYTQSRRVIARPFDDDDDAADHEARGELAAIITPYLQ